ncbi:hypothetical protein [Niveibacterium terrae]|uniref:hypothetical protein n=1 Tax=Niveibacterium terrae TaxID=3373598 RepID=UPI003A8DEA32
MICILLIWSGSAVSGPLQVESRTMVWNKQEVSGSETSWPRSQWADGDIKMPYVRAADPLLAARINDMLYLSMTDSPAPTHPGKTFPVPESGGLDGFASLDFSVERNDDRILSISIGGEGCGAYCENFSNEYSFDAHTGRRLELDDLLTPQGLVAAGQRISRERERRYRVQIKTLNQELAALKMQQKAGKKVDVSDTEERLELNENCLAEVRKGGGSVREEAMMARFSLPAGKGVVFTSGRCSNHASRALDDVYEVETKLSREEVSPWLTAYGKRLLLGEGLAAEPVNPFGLILRGKIGSAAVTVLLHRPYEDGSLSGIYYYQKYRKPIELSGKRTGNRVELVERIAENEQATITLTVSRDSITGQWQDKGKQLPITLFRK